jgi:hypothetical protein
MKIGNIVAPTSRRATTIIIAFAVCLVYARAQTAAEATTFPNNVITALTRVTIFPDNVTILTKSGPIPGNGLKGLMRHVTTCDGFMSRAAADRQGSSLSVCIRGADKTKGSIKVQIQGGYAIKIANTVANEYGEFLFGDVPAGDYTIMATQGTKILALRTIQIPLKLSPVVVDISPHLPFVSTLYLSEY